MVARGREIVCLRIWPRKPFNGGDRLRLHQGIDMGGAPVLVPGRSPFGQRVPVRIAPDRSGVAQSDAHTVQAKCAKHGGLGNAQQPRDGIGVITAWASTGIRSGVSCRIAANCRCL